MTPDQLKAKFPNASADFLKANLHADHSRQAAVMERSAGDESLATNQGQERAAGKLHVRFVSVRKRLLDPDNVSVKWTLDCLRYAGIIRGDEPDKISLEVSQRKTNKGEREQTIIEVI